MADAKLEAILDAEAKGLQSGLKEGEDSLEKLKNTSKGTQAALDDVSDSANRVASSSKKTARGGTNATQILFSLGDAAQDAQFGLAGASNNLAFVGEQLAEETQRAGSFRGAISNLGTAIVGPGGLILALQGLLLIAPQIISFFRDSAEEAGRFEEAVKAAKEATDRVADFQFEVEGVSFDASEIGPALEAARRRLSAYRITIQEVNQDLDEARGQLRSYSQAAGQGGRAAAQQIPVLREQIETLSRQRAALQDNINTWEGRVQSFEEAQQTYRENIDTQRELESLLTEVGGSLDGQAEAVKKANDAWKEQLRIQKSIQAALDARRRDQQVEDVLITGPTNQAPRAVRGASEDITPLLDEQAQTLLKVQEGFTAAEQAGLQFGQRITDQLGLAVTGAQSLSDTLGGVLNSLRNIASELASKALLAGLASLIPGFGQASFFGNLGGLLGFSGRAIGGPVRAGQPYIVGERLEPEIFVPQTSGRVVPSSRFNMGGRLEIALEVGGRFRQRGATTEAAIEQTRVRRRRLGQD